MSAQSIPLPNGIAGLGRSLSGLPRWAYAGLAALIILAIILGIVIPRTDARAEYTTTPVARQTLVDSVTASGTVNPQNTISVGTQVSGTIQSLYVDFNSRVKKGQVLARIDPSTFVAQLDQAKAALAQAQAQAASASATASGANSGVTVASANAAAQKAAIGSAQANVTKAQAALVLAQQQQSRDQQLLAQGFMAQATVDTDRSNTAQDESAVAAAQAALAQAAAQAQASNATVDQNASTAQSQAANAQAAQAAVQSAQATVQQDQFNLDHSVITSPVDGTVVSRAVSIGQTVAASLQTPTLFSIAQDLNKMEVDINVGEPDIGNVKKGDSVDFSVLAYPNTTFHGTVSQVRINPQTLNNVVTYDVVVLVNNNDGKLLPGMTANATINVASQNDALVVPTTALQWKPWSGSTNGASGNAAGASGATAQSPWGAVNGAGATATVTAGSTGTLFVEHGGKLQRVPVNITLTNTTQAAVTPVTPGALNSGDAVVVSSSGGTHHGARSANQTQRSPMSGAAAMGGAMRGIH